MSDHPNVEATRSALEAFMRGDAETMMASISEDAVWHVPGGNAFAGDFAGKAGIGERFEKMAQAGAGAHLDEIHDIVGNDEHVLAMVRITASGAAGSTTQRSVWVFHVKNGKAGEFWGYNEDQAEIDRVFGS
jgi:ketosteroid isomerase-like protein